MEDELKSAKENLLDELKKSPYVKEDPYGNAGCRRKIEKYIIESVIAGVNQADCLDWLDDLFKNNNATEEAIKKTRSFAECQYSVMNRYFDSLKNS